MRCRKRRSCQGRTLLLSTCLPTFRAVGLTRCRAAKASGCCTQGIADRLCVGLEGVAVFRAAHKAGYIGVVTEAPQEVCSDSRAGAARALGPLWTAVTAAATVALVYLQVYAPTSAASLPFGASVVAGPGYPWNGGQGATYEEATHQPKGLTSRDAAASQSSSQLVEGAVGSLLAHLCPLSPKGRTLGD